MKWHWAILFISSASLDLMMMVQSKTVFIIWIKQINILVGKNFMGSFIENDLPDIYFRVCSTSFHFSIFFWLVRLLWTFHLVQSTKILKFCKENVFGRSPLTEESETASVVILCMHKMLKMVGKICYGHFSIKLLYEHISLERLINTQDTSHKANKMHKNTLQPNTLDFIFSPTFSFSLVLYQKFAALLLFLFFFILWVTPTISL